MNKVIKLVIISTAILFGVSSCNIQKRRYFKGYHISTSFYKSTPKLKITTKSDLVNHHEVNVHKNDSVIIFENIKPIQDDDSNIPNQYYQKLIKTHEKEQNTLKNKIHVKTESNKIQFMENKISLFKQNANKSLLIKGKQTDKQTERAMTKRRLAIIIGLSLILMAVIAGVSIPALGSLGASIGMVGVFLLDIIVSLGIYNYHKKEHPKLAKTSGLLRFFYSVILGIAIFYLFVGNVLSFNNVWGIGLIVFGIHLITLGVLFNNEGRKKWVNIAIKSLLIIAGIGYIIQYIGILLVPNPASFVALIEVIFILPMILGEVSYALWMLIKGGKENH